MRQLFWEAHYSDGTKLLQFEEDKENKFGDIDESKLSVFKLGYHLKEYLVRLEDGKFVLDGTVVSFEEFKDQTEFRVIFFLRKLKHMRSLPSGIQDMGEEVFPCIGIRTRIGTSEVKKLFKLMPDGEIRSIDK